MVDAYVGCRAAGVIVCDNSTGDPVSMDIAFSGSERPTLAIVSANFEAANVLKSYANDSSAGYEYRLHTDRCPWALGTLVSQVYIHTTRSPRQSQSLRA